MNFHINLEFWKFGIDVEVTLTPAMAVVIVAVLVIVLWQTITALF